MRLFGIRRVGEREEMSDRTDQKFLKRFGNEEQRSEERMIKGVYESNAEGRWTLGRSYLRRLEESKKWAERSRLITEI